MDRLKPFFTIIIPTFNSANTINIALESILKQDYKNYEILIIDGVSTDETLTLLKNYSCEKIRIYSEPDKGIYDAMNKGIRLAKGRWLYFLGSDDFLYSNSVLEALAAFVTNKQYDVVYGDVNSARFNGRRSGNFLPEMLIQRNLCHQGIIFSKRVFHKIGKFDFKYNAHADWDHNMAWFFNHKISKKYINLIIAEYADGGFSSIHGDAKFQKDKDFKIIKYGWRTLPKTITHHRAIRIVKDTSTPLLIRLSALYYWILLKINDKLLKNNV